MSSETKERGCYCSERNNPKMKEFFEGVPDGYCGFCDICKKPGHMMAHPRSPTTGCWCDEHYEELLSYKIFTLNDIVSIAFPIALLFLTAIIIYSIW